MKAYERPLVEVFEYTVEEGFAQSVAAENDWLLEYDGDMSTLRTGEELTEHTDNDGEFSTYSWD